MPPTHATQARSTRWSLEVVRGRDVGRVFDLAGARSSWATRSTAAAGLDLRDQEGGSPRRMAARQAVLECEGRGPRHSRPGLAGRHVREPPAAARRPGPSAPARRRDPARRRAAPGDGRSPGSSGPSREPPPSGRPSATGPAGRLPVPYAIDGAVSCRTWDDFLVVAAQRWRTSATSWLPAGSPTTCGGSSGPTCCPARMPSRSARRAARPVAGPAARVAIERPELDVHPDQPRGPDRSGRHDATRAADHQRRLSGSCGAPPASSRPARAGSSWRLRSTAALRYDRADGAAGRGGRPRGDERPARRRDRRRIERRDAADRGAGRASRAPPDMPDAVAVPTGTARLGAVPAPGPDDRRISAADPDRGRSPRGAGLPGAGARLGMAPARAAGVADRPSRDCPRWRPSVRRSRPDRGRAEGLAGSARTARPIGSRPVSPPALFGVMAAAVVYAVVLTVERILGAWAVLALGGAACSGRPSARPSRGSPACSYPHRGPSREASPMTIRRLDRGTRS